MTHDGKRAYCCDIRSVIVVDQRRREDDDDNNQYQRVDETRKESLLIEFMVGVALSLRCCSSYEFNKWWK